MKIVLSENYTEINDKQANLSDVLVKLSKLSSQVILQYFTRLNVHIPRDIRINAIRSVLDNKVRNIKILERNLSDEVNYRLNWYEEFSEYQLENLLSLMNEKELIQKYKENLWLGIILANKELGLSDEDVADLIDNEELHQSSESVIETIADYNNAISPLFYDYAPDYIDGLLPEQFRIVLLKSSTLTELREIGKKYNIDIPRRIRKEQLVDIIINELKQRENFDPNIKDKISRMSVMSLQRFAKDNNIKASIELKKEEIIEFILANLDSSNIIRYEKQFNAPEIVVAEENVQFTVSNLQSFIATSTEETQTTQENSEPIVETQEVITEKVVEVPVEVEKIVEVPVETIVEKTVEVPVEVIKEIEVEKIVEVIREIEVEKIVEVPVEVIREIEVEKIVEVPVEVIKEIEVEKIVEVPVEVIKEVIVEKIVEVPAENATERIVEVPVEVIREVIVEKPVEVVVEKIVEVIKEVYIDRNDSENNFETICPVVEVANINVEELEIALREKIEEEVNEEMKETLEKLITEIASLNVKIAQMVDLQSEAVNKSIDAVNKSMEQIKEQYELRMEAQSELKQQQIRPILIDTFTPELTTQAKKETVTLEKNQIMLTNRMQEEKAKREALKEKAIISEQKAKISKNRSRLLFKLIKNLLWIVFTLLIVLVVFSIMYHADILKHDGIIQRIYDFLAVELKMKDLIKNIFDNYEKLIDWIK